MVKTLVGVAMAVVSLVGLLYSQKENVESVNESIQQNLQTVEQYFGFGNDQCTEALAVECVADIEVTVRACAKAFEEQGKDIVADLKCAKDLLADKKVCWPCICYEAQQKHWKIIGC